MITTDNTASGAANDAPTIIDVAAGESIQATIDSAPDKGVVIIRLGAGKWDLSKPFVLKPNQEIKGAGVDKTTISTP